MATAVNTLPCPEMSAGTFINLVTWDNRKQITLQRVEIIKKLPGCNLMTLENINKIITIKYNHNKHLSPKKKQIKPPKILNVMSGNSKKNCRVFKK